MVLGSAGPGAVFVERMSRNCDHSPSVQHKELYCRVPYAPASSSQTVQGKEKIRDGKMGQTSENQLTLESFGSCSKQQLKERSLPPYVSAFRFLPQRVDGEKVREPRLRRPTWQEPTLPAHRHFL